MTEARAGGSKVGAALRVGLALLGLAVTAKILGREGLAELQRALPEVLPSLPACLALELGRVGCEALATRSAAGPIGRRIPVGRLLAGHLVSYAVLTVAPAPRAAAEATKAALFARYVGAAEAAAIGTVVQAGTFVGVGLMSALACGAVLARLAGAGAGATLAGLLAANAAALLALAFAMGAVVRSARLRALVLAKVGPRVAGKLDLDEALDRFHAVFARSPLVMVPPGLWLLAGMLCQVTELWVIGGALGAGIPILGAAAAHGVHLVSATAAVLVPGQFGAREVAFALAAEALGTTAVAAASLALVWHGVQLALAVVGFGVLALWRHRER